MIWHHSGGFRWLRRYYEPHNENCCDQYSVSRETYQFIDYIIASGFCVITDHPHYVDNLESKITQRDETKVLAILDYVDPWYDYDSMIDYPQESQQLEDIAIQKYDQIDGIVMFGNDVWGNLIPQELIVDFSKRFHSAQD